MNCPSCHGGMESLSLRAHLGTQLQIDACWGCQLIWFDPMESVALAPQSVVELFTRIHAAHSVARNVVAMKPPCPHCKSSLALSRDLSRSGSFSYYRCLNGHGRLISFTQFLREKNFIRTLKPVEVQRLALTVKQIRCSSCGASVDLERDTACGHCGSAISVLDEQAVRKTLDEYAARVQPVAIPSQVPATAIHWPSTPPPYLGGAFAANNGLGGASTANNMRGTAVTGGLLVDLVYLGIAALFE